MRRLLLRHRWVTVFTAALLLVATSGVTLSRMTCLMGGHSVLGIGDISDCCPDDAVPDHEAIQAECCAYNAAVGERVLTVGQSGLELHAVLSLIEAAPVLMLSMERSTVRSTLVERRPPPLDMPERLARSGAYLI
jgi:hypothetical protein